MRSNDIFLGLPYDIFLFTMLQELMAAKLGIELGEYHHIAASLHLYERDISRAKTVLSSSNSNPFEMPAMNAVNELSGFIAAEEWIRRSEPSATAWSLSKYWTDLLDVLLLFRDQKKEVRSYGLETRIRRSPYKEVLRPYFDHENR